MVEALQPNRTIDARARPWRKLTYRCLIIRNSTFHQVDQRHENLDKHRFRPDGANLFEIQDVNQNHTI